MQYSNNFNYIFTITDRTSKWMEAIPLSETSVAACAKALTFTWISRFGVGRNLLPTFGFNFAKCLTFHTNKQQLITLSQTVQSKDCTAASRTRFAHALPRQHGPRSYLLYSSDSEHSRGNTVVFPWLRQFSVHKLSCQMNFYKIMNFQFIPLSKNFLKSCMFLLLLCLGTILTPTCPASCQPSCSPPPLIWVRRGGLVPPLKPLYDGPYAVLRRGLRSFTIRVG